MCLCILIHRLRLDFRCEYMRFAMSAVLLNENVVLRLFADFGQMPMWNRDGYTASERDKKIVIRVTHKSHIWKAKRNISVCQCTVKRSMLSCFPFAWYGSTQKRQHRRHQQQFIYQTRCTKEESNTEKKRYDFYTQTEGGRTRRKNLKSVYCAWWWLRGKQRIWKIRVEKKNVPLWVEGERPRVTKKKVLFPLAKTRNYVYYTIGRAHFTFYGRKMTRYKENQTHTHTQHTKPRL